jgi:hypothetical protein
MSDSQESELQLGPDPTPVGPLSASSRCTLLLGVLGGAACGTTMGAAALNWG